MKLSAQKLLLAFLPLFEKFIEDSSKGKRLQPNGKRFSHGTVQNYIYTKRLLITFCDKKNYTLRIRSVRHLNSRELEVEKNYWNKFYKRFTDFLYIDCAHFDNYVGQNIKNIRVFFRYLNTELGIDTGDFYKKFYVRREEIAIYPLMPEELNNLITNEFFENTLSRRMKQVKDFFVFGCTVALRISDLFRLEKSNLRTVNGEHYLSVRSRKTSTDTFVKLPQYAVEILSKYRRSRQLLPHFNKSNLNKYIKKLLELAGLTHFVHKQREKRGFHINIIRGTMDPSKALRFCDVASTHTMRRTAITTMLSLGMPEQIVRQISGHSPGSKEFYKYVVWAQIYQDVETDKVFGKLLAKTA